MYFQVYALLNLKISGLAYLKCLELFKTPSQVLFFFYSICFQSSLLISLPLKIPNYVLRQISQSSQSVYSTTYLIFPLEFLTGILNLTLSKMEFIFQLCLFTSLCQLLSSIVQSPPLVILLDSEFYEMKDYCVLSTGYMGPRTEKALMLYLKKVSFPHIPLHIIIKFYQVYPLSIFQNLSTSLYFCWLLSPGSYHLSFKLLQQLLKLYSLHVFLSVNPDSYSNQSDLYK